MSKFLVFLSSVWSVNSNTFLYTTIRRSVGVWHFGSFHSNSKRLHNSNLYHHLIFLFPMMVSLGVRGEHGQNYSFTNKCPLLCFFFACNRWTTKSSMVKRRGERVQSTKVPFGMERVKLTTMLCTLLKHFLILLSHLSWNREPQTTPWTPACIRRRLNAPCWWAHTWPVSSFVISPTKRKFWAAENL